MQWKFSITEHFLLAVWLHSFTYKHRATIIVIIELHSLFHFYTHTHNQSLSHTYTYSLSHTQYILCLLEHHNSYCMWSCPCVLRNSTNVMPSCSKLELYILTLINYVPLESQTSVGCNIRCFGITQTSVKTLTTRVFHTVLHVKKCFY